MSASILNTRVRRSFACSSRSAAALAIVALDEEAGVFFLLLDPGWSAPPLRRFRDFSFVGVFGAAAFSFVAASFFCGIDEAEKARGRWPVCQYRSASSSAR